MKTLFKYQDMKMLLKIQEFAAQEFWQNWYWLDLLTVCIIFSIFDLGICNITTTQKNITSPVMLSKINKRQGKAILLNEL